jgi:hypothetical protein
MYRRRRINLKSSSFWDMIPYGLVEVYRHFFETSTRGHGARSQKTAVLFIVTAVGISSPT